MRCPKCGAENPPEAGQCADCGRKLMRRPRRRADPDDGDQPNASGPAPRHPTALTAYRCCLVGLVPFLGLIFGPLALVLGIIVWRRDRANVDERNRARAFAAMILGFLALLTNWAGLILMWIGLTSGS